MYGSGDKEYDYMRGIDPASEDDMENYDDEWWNY